MTNIKESIQSIQKNCKGVSILAVSKTQNTAAILEAHDAGLLNFGENYVQEAIPKIEALNKYPLIWHYIGRLQANKCNKIAQYFSWVHTIDNLEIALKLNQSNAKLNQTQNICVQVNLLAEPQKGGIPPIELPKFVATILNFSQLKLQGLMTILPEGLTPEEQIVAYLELKNLLLSINERFKLNLQTLSMGMSNDYQEAIAAGSTMIRLGQAIFGARTKKDQS